MGNQKLIVQLYYSVKAFLIQNCLLVKKFLNLKGNYSPVLVLSWALIGAALEAIIEI